MSKTGNKLLDIAGLFENWLDYQEAEYSSGGTPIDDDTHFMTMPVYPTRGNIKAWVKTLKEANQELKENQPEE